MKLIPGLTAVDLLDIGIFAVAVYILLALGIRHGSKRGFAVVALLATIYVMADQWQMPLALAVSRIGFSATIVSLAIIYQDDVRAAAERVGRWLLGSRPGRRSLSAGVDDILVRASFRMADQKNGALIVVKGRDALERVIDGGIELDAVVSEPLLYSLFDPNSPGHDGAIIIDGNRIARFATHLPLAKSGRAAEFGTRHHAAVGLADCCDAVVLVVSEERGVVSVAHGGKLAVVTDPDALLTQLQDFGKYRRQNERNVSFHRLFREKIALKLAAFVIAVCCWLVVGNDSADIYRTFLVPIQYRNVPAGVRLSQTLTQELRVTLVGSESAFHFLAPSALVASIDLSEVANGKRTFTVTPESVRRPGNLRVSAVEPRSVQVAIETKQSRQKTGQ